VEGRQCTFIVERELRTLFSLCFQSCLGSSKLPCAVNVLCIVDLGFVFYGLRTIWSMIFAS
jgi:hypothetical protein